MPRWLSAPLGFNKTQRGCTPVENYANGDHEQQIQHPLSSLNLTNFQFFYFSPTKMVKIIPCENFTGSYMAGMNTLKELIYR